MKKEKSSVAFVDFSYDFYDMSIAIYCNPVGTELAKTEISIFLRKNRKNENCNSVGTECA